MGRIFIWLAGTDRELLEKCTKLTKSEKIRFVGFGTLVLIPSILGLFSMMYAISTISENPYIFVTAGIVWSLIVLFIDRFLVSTIYKSALKARKGNVLAIIVRYVFAMFIGIAVSHPLILLWFNKSITQQIGENKDEAIQKRIEESQNQKSNIKTSAAFQAWSDKTKHRDCLQKLLTAEQSGTKVELDCGSSSGILNYGSRARVIERQIDQVNKELTLLALNLTPEVEQLRQKSQSIDERLQQDIRNIEKRFSDDYLARVTALSQIEQDHPHITIVKWFMLLFFVFVDILPITMKLATSIGEYEEIRDTLLFEVQVIQEAEKAVITANYAGNAYSSLLQARFNHKAMRDEIIDITQVTLDFIEQQERQSVKFDRQFKETNERINKVRDNEVKKYYEAYLINMKNIFHEAWTKAMNRFHAYLKSL